VSLSLPYDSTVSGIPLKAKISHQIFLDEELVLKKIHQELVTILGTDVCGWSQIKIWLQKVTNGNWSCKDAPRTGLPPLTLTPQLAASLQKCSFACAQLLAQHLLTTAPTIKEILQRALELKNSRRAGCPIF
jgi:hypothetical protein